MNEHDERMLARLAAVEAQYAALEIGIARELGFESASIRLSLDGDCVVGVLLADRIFTKEAFDLIRATGHRCCINVGIQEGFDAEVVAAELDALTPWRAWRRVFRYCEATVRAG